VHEGLEAFRYYVVCDGWAVLIQNLFQSLQDQSPLSPLQTVTPDQYQTPIGVMVLQVMEVVIVPDSEVVKTDGIGLSS
jgi:hypothetical protein